MLLLVAGETAADDYWNVEDDSGLAPPFSPEETEAHTSVDSLELIQHGSSRARI